MPEGGDNADDVMNVTDPISGLRSRLHCIVSIARCAMKLAGMGCFISEAGTWLSDSWLNFKRGFGPIFNGGHMAGLTKDKEHSVKPHKKRKLS